MLTHKNKSVPVRILQVRQNVRMLIDPEFKHFSDKDIARIVHISRGVETDALRRACIRLLDIGHKAHDPELIVGARRRLLYLQAGLLKRDKASTLDTLRSMNTQDLKGGI